MASCAQSWLRHLVPFRCLLMNCFALCRTQCLSGGENDRPRRHMARPRAGIRGSRRPAPAAGRMGGEVSPGVRRPAPGRWNPLTVPMVLEPMRAASQHSTRQVTICAPSQLMKSDFCVNLAVWGAHYGDDVGFWEPDRELAARFLQGPNP